MRVLVVVTLMSLLVLSACTTTDARVAVRASELRAQGARVLVVFPDVQLGLLTANGLVEPREDWSQQSATNLAFGLRTALAERAHEHAVLDARTSMSGRVGQVLRLNSAVGQSIGMFEYGPYKLPSKSGQFDWTVGDGARTLAESQSSEYALFVGGRGSFTSDGRMALAVGAALLGVSIPVGSQQVSLSLVELKSGRVLWINLANAGNSADIRTAEGARSIIDDLLEGAPL